MYLRGVLVDGLVRGGGVADDLVLDVGDVHHVVELEAARREPAAQDVLKSEGPQVADVDVVVDRRPAGVHAHHVAVQRGEGLHFLGEGVVETQGHSETIPSIVAARGAGPGWERRYVVRCILRS